MSTSNEIWNAYHAAVSSGDVALAERLLQTLKHFSGNAPSNPGGCARCRRKI